MAASTGMLEAKELQNYLQGKVEVDNNEELFNLFFNTSKKKDQVPQYNSNQKHMQSLFEHYSNDSYLL